MYSSQYVDEDKGVHRCIKGNRVYCILMKMWYHILLLLFGILKKYDMCRY